MLSEYKLYVDTLTFFKHCKQGICLGSKEGQSENILNGICE